MRPEIAELGLQILRDPDASRFYVASQCLLELGDILRHTIKASGLSNEELAAKLLWEPEYVAKVLAKGTDRVTIGDFVDICIAAGRLPWLTTVSLSAYIEEEREKMERYARGE